jgi:formylglycine-generating enzyme required for sulfatase activity
MQLLNACCALLGVRAAADAAPPSAGALCAADDVHHPPPRHLLHTGAPMVCLPGGAFLYGNAFPGESYAVDGEAAQQLVHVSPFACDATEVTYTQFAAFVNATGHATGA